MFHEECYDMFGSRHDQKIRALLLNSAVGLCVGCVLLDLTQGGFRL